MEEETTENVTTDFASGKGTKSGCSVKENHRRMSDLDSGWAWMVCLSCFVVNFIADGLFFSFGIIQLKLLDRFEDSRSKTSWVGSIYLGVCMSMGPAVSILLEFYSCRQVIILGGIVSFVGYGVSVFAPNVSTLMFTLGVLGGAGFGLSLLTSYLAVSLHFTTKRARATGIATSGSGLGILVTSYVTERLFNVYGWQGTMLLIAGLVLNCIVCGSLVRLLTKKKYTSHFPCCQKSKCDKNQTNPDISCKGQDNSFRITKSVEESSPSQNYQQRTCKQNYTYPDISCKEQENSSRITKCFEESNLLQNYQQRTCEKNYTDPGVSCKEHDNFVQVIKELNPSQNYQQSTKFPEKTQSQELHGVEMLLNSEERTCLTRSLDHILPTLADERVLKSDCHLHQAGLQKRGELDPIRTRTLFNTLKEPLKPKDICYSGSNFNLPENQLERYKRSFQSSMSELSSDSQQVNKASFAQEKTSFINSYRDLLCDKVFLMLLFVTASYTGLFTGFMFLPDMAIQKGVFRTNTALLVSMVGVPNTIGRLVAGTLANYPSIDSVALHTGALLLGSITSLAFPFCSTLWMFIVCSLLFGLSIGMCISLRTIVLADVLGISKLTKSFGLVTFLQGILYTIGPPISGALFDRTKSFVPPYILTAAVYGLGTVTCALIRPVQRWLNKSTKNTEQGESFIDENCDR